MYVLLEDNLDKIEEEVVREDISFKQDKDLGFFGEENSFGKRKRCNLNFIFIL